MSKKSPDKKSKPNPAIVIALIGLIGTLITAIFTSPVLIELIKRSSATPTSSATLSAPPSSAALIFTQNFDDNSMSGFALRDGDWKIVRDKSNPVLQFSAVGSNWPAGRMIFGPSEISDAVIEFRVQFEELSGLYLNFREQPSGSYSLSLDPVDSVIVWAIHTVGDSNWQPIISQPFTFQQDVWYSVRVEAFGEQVVVSINGNRSISASDPSFKNGSLRFELQPNAVVLIDDVNIWSHEP